MMTPSFARRMGLSVGLLECCQNGEDIRNWSMDSELVALRPYERNWEPIKLAEYPTDAAYLKLFRRPLGNRATFSGKTYDEEGKLWYGYHIINHKKLVNSTLVALSFVATHNHFVAQPSGRLYRQSAPIIVLRGARDSSAHLLQAALNSSAALFWLKQVCFSKRESEEGATD